MTRWRTGGRSRPVILCFAKDLRARLSLALVLILAIAAPGAAAESSEGNLLRNGAFEGGAYHASMSSFVPEGWSRWFQHRGADDPGWWLPEPEYGLIQDRGGQAHSGRTSLRWFNSWAIHNAGVYQVASVPADAWVRFSVWALNWSSQNDQFPVSDGFHRTWIGVDPTGGTDPYGPSIVWSDEDRTMDEWTRLTVTARARGDLVTVFVRNQPEYATKHNDVLLDDAELVVVDGPPEMPAPVGTFRVATPTPAPLATNTTLGRAVELTELPTAGALVGSPDVSYAYFIFTYPGGERPYQVEVAAWPDGQPALGQFGFQVFGPRWDDVYAMSGLRIGGFPNVSGTLRVGERGRYVVRVHNGDADGQRVDYRIWLTPPEPTTRKGPLAT